MSSKQYGSAGTESLITTLNGYVDNLEGYTDSLEGYTDGVESLLKGVDTSGFEQITVDNTVGGKALTGAEYGTSTHAFIYVETAQIRFTVDGTAPTTSVGILADPGDVIELDSNADIVAFRAIRATAVSALIGCNYASKVV